MKMGVTITRKGNTGSALAAHARVLAAKVAAGMKAAGETLHELADELVPMDTAALAMSGGTRHEGTGFDTEVVVFYGKKGFAVTAVSRHEGGRIVHRNPFEYAVRVHQGVGGVPVGMAYPPIEGFSEFLLKPMMDKQDTLRQSLNSLLV